MTLQAVIADALGPIENYALRAHDPGRPGPGSVRVSVRAAGVSFVDVLNAKGMYQSKAAVPFIPGSEFSGVVEALGEGVDQFAPGQRVMGTHWGGAFAHALNVPARNLRCVPEGMGFAEASIFMVSAMTSWHALVDRANLSRGEILLVLGAAGATGYAAVQIGKHLGARVIASASSADKRAVAINGGADEAIDARAENWREAVRAANGGKPIDVVFDPVGGAATEAAFRSLGWKGRHLIVGFPAGIAALPTNLALLKGASLVGINMEQFNLAEPRRADANAVQLVALAQMGLFRPVIAATFRLDQFAKAMRLAASGESAGRVILLINRGEAEAER